ncbi:MAG: SDR family NAD(P)-dependent oxidoreductase, partial [Gammaproteobacteria bacterium]|nr:SDR family NAD(P)-dependent oxidoreductase [Gammaproteobacteria bacterium]
AVQALKSSQKLSLANLTQNQSIYSIDLRRLLSEKNNNKLIEHIFSAMKELVESKEIVPVVSKIYPITYIKEALQYVARGEHIGKVVMTHTGENIVDCLDICLDHLEQQAKRAELMSKEISKQNVIISKKQAITSDAVAIIGMSGQFPKAETLDEYWKNIKEGRDCISLVPESRWDVDLYYDANPDIPGKTYCKHIGFLEGANKFDPLFFRISPKEAEHMDPQQRLFLQVAWHALEDSGYSSSSISGQKCGVFVGCSTSNYGRILLTKLDALDLVGNNSAILAARISYILNLKGPCLSIDTACSSSLVAIAQACDSLILGESNIALAGGVCVLSDASIHIMTSKAGMLSAKGRCYAFDQRADGFVPGEGVGVLVLKRLSDAISDGDRIYGLISGWGINQDGKTNGITAPSVCSQVMLEKEIYEKFKINPGEIELLEAHALGSKLGDPIEVEALRESFEFFSNNKGYCALGSAKSNIGHTLTAAGVAGVIKALLAIQHKKIPPTINFEKLNENINLNDSPFYINTELRSWEAQDGKPRKAAVSSFGFSGINAHVVLEEYISPYKPRNVRNIPIFIVLSAKNKERLKTYAGKLLEFIKVDKKEENQEESSITLLDLSYTLQVGREAMECRLGMLVHSFDELKEKLRAYLNKQEETFIEDLYIGQVNKNQDTLATFATDEEFQEVISKYIQHGKYNKLLELWVRGLNIDWERLYQDLSPEQKPRRISAPTYPFAKEQYWAGTKVEPASYFPQHKIILHPFLHENTSTLSEQRFSSTFTGNEFFLKDHVVLNHKILPGVVHLEMARAAAVLSTQENEYDELLSNTSQTYPVILKNIIWVSPVVVDEAPRTIHIGIYPKSYNEMEYEIRTSLDEIHSQGEIVVSTPLAIPKQFMLSEIRTRCSQSLDSRELYSRAAKQGIHYGVSFQGIQNIYYNDSEVLAELAVKDSESGFVLNPSLLDSAIQAGLILGDSGKTQLQSLPYVPFALKELCVYDALENVRYSYVRAHTQNKLGNDLKKSDIFLLDEQGHVLLAFKELSARSMILRLNEDIDATTVKNSPQMIYAKPEWQDAVLAIMKKKIKGDLAVERLTLKWTEDRNAQTIVDEFQQAFARIKAFLMSKPKDKKLFLCLVPAEYPEYCYAPLVGLLKTATIENPKVLGKVIQLPLGCSDSQREMLEKQEIQATEADLSQSSVNRIVEVRYLSESKRQIRQLVEADIKMGSLDQVVKSGGVYFITGGAGGLGRLFATYLSQIANVKVILMGRSDQPKQALPASSAISYIQGDVSKYADVQAALELIRDQYGSINGIIHSAGVIQDNFILNKTAEEIETVLSAKIQGAWNIHQAMRQQPVDWVVFFSSIAGTLGNVGQADYAGANAFLDRFAEVHGYKSIAWPLWQEGGMQMDAASEERMYEKTGMQGLQTQKGLETFIDVLMSEESNLLVSQGNDELLRRFLFGDVGGIDEF